MVCLLRLLSLGGDGFFVVWEMVEGYFPRTKSLNPLQLFGIERVMVIHGSFFCVCGCGFTPGRGGWWVTGLCINAVICLALGSDFWGDWGSSLVWFYEFRGDKRTLGTWFMDGGWAALNCLRGRLLLLLARVNKWGDRRGSRDGGGKGRGGIKVGLLGRDYPCFILVCWGLGWGVGGVWRITMGGNNLIGILAIFCGNYPWNFWCIFMGGKVRPLFLGLKGLRGEISRYFFSFRGRSDGGLSWLLGFEKMFVRDDLRVNLLPF